MQVNKILLVGYGGLGQGLTPLLFTHFPGLKASDVYVVTADNSGQEVADSYGIQFRIEPLTPTNYEQVLAPLIGEGDMLINVSVNVSSCALIEWCQRNGVLYLDTCVEPWEGGYKASDAVQTTNYALRESALAMRDYHKPTAIIAHGANPGLVTHFVKKGLFALAKLKNIPICGGYAEMAQQLGIKVIHIAERDTQTDNIPLKAGEFANTWSVDGLLSEAQQQAEMGWGTHETTLPDNARRYGFGSEAGVYLTTPSAEVKVKSWVPSMGEQDAYLITHHEAISIAEFLTIQTNDGPAYRPTVYYAYHPSEKTVESLEQWKKNGYNEPEVKTLMRDAIVDGYDELGVLFVYDGGAYWYGSTLSNQEARGLAKHNNATALQVTSSIIGAMKWMLKCPNHGVVEPEDVDSFGVLQVALPYLGRVNGYETDWQPNGIGKLQFNDFLGGT